MDNFSGQNLESMGLSVAKDPAVCLVYNIFGQRGQRVSRSDFYRTILKEQREITAEALNQKDKNTPKICAEGDSWIIILWPWSQILGYHRTFFDVIQEKLYYNNELGYPGDTFQQMLTEKDYENPMKSGIFDFFIFSGGGNDVLGGGALYDLLKWRESGHQSENPKYYVDDRILHDRLETLKSGYLTIAKEAWVWSSQKTRMLVHGYDYPIPRRNEPWLGRPFESRGYDLIADADLIGTILELLVDRFYAMLEDVAAESANVIVVDLRRVCAGRWHDELHPTTAASRDFAQRFIDVIGPPRVG